MVTLMCAKDNLDISFRMDSNSVKWKSISLTHVQYIEGDPLGYLLAWSSLLPIFIFVSVVTLVLFRRDLHTICFGAGLLGNELLNKIIKNVIKEARPEASGRECLHTHGMPSDHSQYMAFFASYMILFLMLRAHRTSSFKEELWKYILSVVIIFASSIVFWSRIYLQYHTAPQVVWGVIVGIVIGILWFALVQFVFTPLFPMITSWRISEFLMIRDYTLIPNVIWFEYCQVRAEVRARQRKRNSRKSQ